MTLLDLPDQFQMALALHQGLLHLGFAPENSITSVCLSEDDERWACIVVKQGAIEHTIGLGPLDIDDAEYVRQWTEAAALWNSGSQEDKLAVWLGTEPKEWLPEVARWLRESGMVLPREAN